MVFPECLRVLADILNCVIMFHYFRCFILKDEILKKSIHSINPTPVLITIDFLFCWYIWLSKHLCLYSRKLIATWRESECLKKKKRKKNKTPENIKLAFHFSTWKKTFISNLKYYRATACFHRKENSNILNTKIQISWSNIWCQYLITHFANET